MRTIIWLIATLSIANAQSGASTVWTGQWYKGPSDISISSNGKALVIIKADGTIEYGPEYNPDEAARLFWEAIGQHKPKDCK